MRAKRLLLLFANFCFVFMVGFSTMPSCSSESGDDLVPGSVTASYCLADKEMTGEAPQYYYTIYCDDERVFSTESVWASLNEDTFNERQAKLVEEMSTKMTVLGYHIVAYFGDSKSPVYYLFSPRINIKEDKTRYALALSTIHADSGMFSGQRGYDILIAEDPATITLKNSTEEDLGAYMSKKSYSLEDRFNDDEKNPKLLFTAPEEK